MNNAHEFEQTSCILSNVPIQKIFDQKSSHPYGNGQGTLFLLINPHILVQFTNSKLNRTIKQLKITFTSCITFKAKKTNGSTR